MSNWDGMDDIGKQDMHDNFGEFAEMAPAIMMIGRLEAAGIQIRAIVLPRDLLKGPGTVYGRPVVRADVDEPGVLV